MVLRLWFKEIEEAEKFRVNVSSYAELQGTLRPHGNPVLDVIPYRPLEETYWSKNGYKARILICPRAGKFVRPDEAEAEMVISYVLDAIKESKPEGLCSIDVNFSSGGDFYELREIP